MKKHLHILSLILSLVLFSDYSLLAQSDSRLIFNENLKSTQTQFSQLSGNSKTLTIEIPSITINDYIADKKLFHEISIPGSGLINVEGLPKLPAFRKLIEVPEGMSLTVEIISVESQIIENVRPVPYQKAQNRNDYLAGVQTDFTINRDFYDGQEIYPATQLLLGNYQYMGSSRVIDLLIYPVRYNPSDLSIEVMSKMIVKLNFTKDKSSKVTSITSNGASLDRISNLMVEKFDSRSRALNEKETPQMLIITHDDFYTNILPFADWKNKQGIRTRVIKLSQLANKRDAEDIKLLIRSFLQDSANMKGLEYVLFVGDVDYIPAFYGVYNALNDHDYVTINGDDYLPDLVIGRFSVNSPEECDLYVQKMMNYERYISVSDSSKWFSSAVSAASNSHLDDMNGRHVVAEFKHNGFTKVDDLRANLQSFTNYKIINALNEGRSWMFYIGHGDETGWLTTGGFTRNTIDNNLTYQDMLPAIISVACSNVDLDFGYGDCFAERFMKAGPNKGAIAFLGATELTPFFLSDTLGKYALFSYLNGEVNTFGEAMVYGKMKMYEAFTDNSQNSETKETMEHFLILGDPTLQPWTEKPQTITTNRPTQIKPGFAEFTFNVKADGQLVKNAIVCISNSTYSVYSAAYTDKNGNVSFAINTQDTGKLSVVITGRNLMPYEGIISIKTILSEDENELNNEISIFPNPFTGSVNIIAGNGSTTIDQVELLDMNGKVIFSQNQIGSSRFLLTPPLLESGVYLLKVTDVAGHLMVSKLSH